MTSDVTELRRRMEGAMKTVEGEFTGLRTGRASPNLLDSIRVDAYGSPMAMNQVASVSAPEPRLLTVQVWDASLAKAVEKAIRESGLGLNPAAEGQVIRVPLPQLSEDRRKEMVKVAGKYAEACRVSIRNVRRDGMDTLKKDEKDGKISKDEHHKQSEIIQKLTDEFIKRVDDMLVTKEKEILTV